MRLSFFSTRAAQEAQVIPPMSSSTSDVLPIAPAVSVVVLVMSGLQTSDRTVRSQYQLVGTAGR